MTPRSRRSAASLFNSPQRIPALARLRWRRSEVQARLPYPLSRTALQGHPPPLAATSWPVTPIPSPITPRLAISCFSIQHHRRAEVLTSYFLRQPMALIRRTRTTTPFLLPIGSRTVLPQAETEIYA